LPTARRVLVLIWKNMKAFIIRIATIVFALNVIIWLLSNFSFTFAYVGGDIATRGDSIMATLAGLISWIFAPLGFGTWEATTSLLSGLAAKESVIAVLQSLAPADGLSLFIKEMFNGDSIAAISFVTFVLLYVPCIAAVSSIRKEIGRRWAWFSVGLQMGAAYFVSLIVYWFGRLVTSGDIGLIIGVLLAILVICYSVFILVRSFRKRKLCGGCAQSIYCDKKKCDIEAVNKDEGK